MRSSFVVAANLSCQKYTIPICKVFAWTDSIVVLYWIAGNPRQYKTFVGNRISDIIDLVPPSQWKHVSGDDNPADCASQGLFPSELLEHRLWWNGSEWLSSEPIPCPAQINLSQDEALDILELKVHHVSLAVSVTTSILSVSMYSSFSKVQSIVGWMFRFINNCKGHKYSRSTNTLFVYR